MSSNIFLKNNRLFKIKSDVKELRKLNPIGYNRERLYKILGFVFLKDVFDYKINIFEPKYFNDVSLHNIAMDVESLKLQIELTINCN